MFSTLLRLYLADRWNEESVDHTGVSNLGNTTGLKVISLLALHSMPKAKRDVFKPFVIYIGLTITCSWKPQKVEVVQSEILPCYSKHQRFVPENNILFHNSSSLCVTFPANTENNSLPCFSRRHFTYLSTALMSPQCTSSGQNPLRIHFFIKVMFSRLLVICLHVSKCECPKNWKPYFMQSLVKWDLSYLWQPRFYIQVWYLLCFFFSTLHQ